MYKQNNEIRLLVQKHSDFKKSKVWVAKIFLPSQVIDFRRFRRFFREEQAGIFDQRSKDKKDAGKHPGFNGCQTFSFRSVGRHCIENIHQDQKEGD